MVLCCAIGFQATSFLDDAIDHRPLRVVQPWMVLEWPTLVMIDWPTSVMIDSTNKRVVSTGQVRRSTGQHV
eukprot:365135-Rhodomonas_salina.1